MAEAQFIPGYGAAQQVNQNLQVAQSMMMRAVDYERRKQLLPLQVAEAGLKVKAMQNSLAWDEKLKSAKLKEIENAAYMNEVESWNKYTMYNQGVAAQEILPTAWTRLNQATTIEELTNLEAEVSQGAGLAVSAPNFKPHYESLMQSIKSKRTDLKDKQNEKYRENTYDPNAAPEIAAYRKQHTFADGSKAWTDEPNEKGMAIVRQARVAVSAATTPQEALQALTVPGFEYLPDDQQESIEKLAMERAQELRLLDGKDSSFIKGLDEVARFIAEGKDQLAIARYNSITRADEFSSAYIKPEEIDRLKQIISFGGQQQEGVDEEPKGEDEKQSMLKKLRDALIQDRYPT